MKKKIKMYKLKMSSLLNLFRCRRQKTHSEKFLEKQFKVIGNEFPTDPDEKKIAKLYACKLDIMTNFLKKKDLSMSNIEAVGSNLSYYSYNIAHLHEKIRQAEARQREILHYTLKEAAGDTVKCSPLKALSDALSSSTESKS